ncbi:MAG TPA: DUF4058 domain-containing protein [Gemmataceae bacterium]|nr:DUF4058 domain-containing protein [Gemmataceae bacterium]
MPIHDWTRVDGCIFDDFHLNWICTTKHALNGGLLPPDYYALIEQTAEGFGPQIENYTHKRNRIGIRHVSGDRVVAILEIASPRTKANRSALRSLVENVVASFDRGIHLLILDLLPPGPRDPQGIHAAIWSEIEDDHFQLPADKPLTLASYEAGAPKTAYIEPVAVGDTLPDMPLFLEPGFYVPVPLEATYRAAWDAVPKRWREVLEPHGPGST